MLHIKRSVACISILIVSVIVFFIVAMYVTHFMSTPENDREWTLDQKVLPYAEFDNNFVTIKNIRNFSYTSGHTYTPSYYDKTYNIDELESVDFIVEPLAEIAVAHTFLSFGFENGEYLAISVEIRKEVGEEFSPLKGLFDQFELMYVIADERDVIRLRTLYRNDTLYLYPTIVTKEKVKELFIHMIHRVNDLKKTPEFYNTITNTCTTNIVDHINAITERRVPWDLRVLFPLDSDEYAYELGLIDTSIPFQELRATHKINAYVDTYQDAPNFSQKIREHLQK